MSCLTLYDKRFITKFVPFGDSITLLTLERVAEDGRFVSRSKFSEFKFSEQPYSSTSIDEYSVNAIAAAGANPAQVFIQSSDVDSVISSVNRLRDCLTPKSN